MATTTGAISTMTSGHPSLGRAPEATIIPVSLTCYRIVLGDAAKGYVCSVEDGWECFAGAHMADARSIGVRRTLTTAIRDLVSDIPTELVGEFAAAA
jgi:hypothetical protein